MSANSYAFTQGMAATRGTLRRWNEAPWSALRGWLGLSLAIALALLAATWAVAAGTQPDLTVFQIPGISGDADLSNVAGILYRNSFVLALHATACLAGFIAGASMPIAAAQRTGLSRWVHVRAAQFAMIFVTTVTVVSLVTQAWALGFQGSTIAFQVGIAPAELVLSVLPHAVPELVALFLPLAAWLIASRRGDWDQLLAATFVTVVIAIPILIASAFIEVFVWPDVMQALGATDPDPWAG